MSRELYLDVATQSASTQPASRQAEVLTERQEKIDQIVMDMTGVMSSGDVTKQQVEPIAFGFAALSRMLEEMLTRKRIQCPAMTSISDFKHYCKR